MSALMDQPADQVAAARKALLALEAYAAQLRELLETAREAIAEGELVLAQKGEAAAGYGSAAD